MNRVRATPLMLELAAAACFAVSLAWTHWVSLALSVGSDAGFYLMNTAQVRAGRVPYLDFHIVYTPAFFYVQQVYEKILGSSRFEIHCEIWAHMIALFLLVALVMRVELGA